MIDLSRTYHLLIPWQRNIDVLTLHLAVCKKTEIACTFEMIHQWLHVQYLLFRIMHLFLFPCLAWVRGSLKHLCEISELHKKKNE